jgi:hypothetical protein
MKSLLPATAGLMMNGINTLPDTGLTGVCCAVAMDSGRSNSTLKETALGMLILSMIYCLFIVITENPVPSYIWTFNFIIAGWNYL